MVEFINKNVFAMCSTEPHLLYLFEITCVDGSHSPNAIKLLHTVELSFDRKSDIRRFPGVSMLVTLFSDELKGVVIPHDKTIPPTVVELGRCGSDWDPRHCCALGISASLFFNETDRTCEILAHEWNLSCSVSSKHSYLLDRPRRFPRLVRFDQDTGRLVFPSSYDSILLDIV